MSGCRHERDPFNCMRCWKCGKKMRAPSMYGTKRRGIGASAGKGASIPSGSPDGGTR